MNAITIKIKGAEGVRQLAALGGNTKVVGLGKGTMAMGKGLAARGGEIEGARLITLKGALAKAGGGEAGRTLVFSAKPGTALMLQGGELEKLTILQSPAAPQAAKAAAVAKSLPPTAPAVAKSVGAVKSGALWSGTGFGLGSGMLGPLLVLTGLSVVATGLYVYMRSRQFEEYDDESFVEA